MDTRPPPVPFAERVLAVSSPNDLLGLHREAIETNLKAVQPLDEQYQAAMDQSQRGTAITIGRQIEGLTAQLVRNTGAVQARIVELFPTAEAAVQASELIADPKEKTGFISLWAHAKA